MKIGVLSLQGAYRLHADVLVALGAEPVDVRTPDALAAVDAVVIPGGESTTMSFLLDSSGLREPLRERLLDGLPALGTCAGMIMLATEVLDGRLDQESLGVIDIAVRRNAFGRQRESFEADLAIDGLPGGPIRFEIDNALFGIADARRHLISVDPQAQLALQQFGEAQKLTDPRRTERTAPSPREPRTTTEATFS